METEAVVEVDVIETFAGNGKSRSTGDGKRAKKAGIPLPNQVTVDREGRYLYIAECGSDRVRRVDLESGLLHNFAGIGETCYSGDYGPCEEAGLYLPLDVVCDSKNNLYVCDSGSNRIRKIDAETGIITTVVGTGQWGFIICHPLKLCGFHCNTGGISLGTVSEIDLGDLVRDM